MGPADEALEALVKHAEAARRRYIAELTDASDMAKNAANACAIAARDPDPGETIRFEMIAESLMDYARIAMYRAERELGAWQALRLRAAAMMGKLGSEVDPIEVESAEPEAEDEPEPQPLKTRVWFWIGLKLGVFDDGED